MARFSARSDDLNYVAWRKPKRKLRYLAEYLKFTWKVALIVTAFELVITVIMAIYDRFFCWGSSLIFALEAAINVLPSVIFLFTRRTDLIRFEIVASLHLIISLIIDPGDLLKTSSLGVFKLTVTLDSPELLLLDCEIVASLGSPVFCWSTWNVCHLKTPVAFYTLLSAKEEMCNWPN